MEGYEEGDTKLKLAIAIDETVRRVRPDDWRGNQARENEIKRALLPLLRNLPHEVERVFLIIKQQQRKLREQDREQPREYLDRESHYVWGRRYLLKVAAHDGAPSVEIKHRQLVLRVREPRSEESKQAALDEWYRSLVKQAAPDLIAKWEPVIGVNVRGVLVRKMKTLWGSCSPERGTIRLNVELAKKPPDCLEYILVHELVHLLEPTHNARFVKLLGQFMPKWQFYRDELNRLPVRHETWRY